MFVNPLKFKAESLSHPIFYFITNILTILWCALASFHPPIPSSIYYGTSISSHFSIEKQNINKNRQLQKYYSNIMSVCIYTEHFLWERYFILLFLLCRLYFALRTSETYTCITIWTTEAEKCAFKYILFLFTYDSSACTRFRP